MRGIVVCVLVLASVVAQAQPRGEGHGRHERPDVSRREMDAQLDKVEERLERALKLLGRGEARRNVREAADELKELRRLLAVRDRDDHPRDPPPPPPPPRPRTIESAALGVLLDAVSREPRPDSQVRIVEQAAPENLFLVEHVRMVLERVRGDAQRLRAASAFRGRIVDTQNNFVLLTLFSASSDKATLQRILAGDDAATGGMRAISEADLRILVKAIQSRPSSSQRYAFLADRAPELWFTTVQARRILDTFYSSTDRMKALRVLRPRLLDPQNGEPVVTAFLGSRDRAEAAELLR